MDELVDKLTIIPLSSGTFPLSIQKEESDNEMNDEFMIDLVRQIHCCANKNAVLDKLRDK